MHRNIDRIKPSVLAIYLVPKYIIFRKKKQGKWIFVNIDSIVG